MFTTPADGNRKFGIAGTDSGDTGGGGGGGAEGVVKATTFDQAPLPSEFVARNR